VGAAALAVHPGALGDVLLAVPALRALGASAGAPVTLAAAPRLGELLAALGVVAEHVALDALGLDALFTPGPDRRPRLPETSRLVCWLGARDPGFVQRLTDLVPGAVVAPSAVAGRPVWAHLLDTVGAPPGDWRAAIAASPAVRAQGAEALAAARMELPPPSLVVHPGAGGPAKCWPAEAFARVVTTAAARARMNVIVHQGPADAAAGAALRRHLGAGVVWLVEPALPALAGVLAHAHAFLGNDSGVSHLAAALGVPSVVLFDARHLAWRPWWTGARARTVTLAATVDAEVDAVIEDLLGLLR
jgi:ADP-heptose:LPS heptosyltransferase